MRQLTKTRDEAHLNENTNENKTCVFHEKSHRKYENSKIKLYVQVNYNIIIYNQTKLNKNN